MMPRARGSSGPSPEPHLEPRRLALGGTVDAGAPRPSRRSAGGGGAPAGCGPGRPSRQSSRRPRLRRPTARPAVAVARRVGRRPRRAGRRGTRRPPPARSSTHARPPCSSANIATSDSPMPVPGACARRPSGPGGTARRSRRRRSAGHAGPVVLDGDDRAAVLRPDPDPDPPRRARCVATAFITRFSTIRSTLARIDRHDDRLGLDEDRRARRGRRGSRPSGRTSAPTSEGRHLRRDDPAREPVDVEQVLEEPVELAGVRRQPAEQVLLVRARRAAAARA